MVESIFLSEIYVVNRLGSSIHHCDPHEVPQCIHEIASGKSERMIYMSNSSKHKGKYDGFDRLTIKMCGKLVPLKLIRTISPVIRHKGEVYFISIDQNVFDTICESDNGGTGSGPAM